MNSPLILEQKLKAPIEKVWKALTDKEEMKKWYFDIPDFKLELHHRFYFYEPGEEKRFLHEGKILEFIPNKKLKHSWAYPELTLLQTMLTWELTEVEQETNLLLRHEGLENFQHLGPEFSLENFQLGWNENVKIQLRNYVEQQV